jgi:hypothetical protein
MVFARLTCQFKVTVEPFGTATCAVPGVVATETMFAWAVEPTAMRKLKARSRNGIRRDRAVLDVMAPLPSIRNGRRYP